MHWRHCHACPKRRAHGGRGVPAGPALKHADKGLWPPPPHRKLHPGRQRHRAAPLARSQRHTCRHLRGAGKRSQNPRWMLCWGALWLRIILSLPRSQDRCLLLWGRHLTCLMLWVLLCCLLSSGDSGCQVGWYRFLFQDGPQPSRARVSCSSHTPRCFLAGCAVFGPWRLPVIHGLVCSIRIALWMQLLFGLVTSLQNHLIGLLGLWPGTRNCVAGRVHFHCRRRPLLFITCFYL
mmetsp:Transcript_39508/g.93778  ORF Transcript_39508/g.93778 Transcript_39508/m.93778 type:complete len:235 (-) Transcript_39508:703-1407(-)